MKSTQTCRDCGVSPGELHKRGCLIERCPFCNGQLVACGCIKRVIQLSPAEAAAVDEYRDDSQEPLKSVLKRWAEALSEKGRISWAPPPPPEKVLRIGIRREPGFEYILRDSAILRAPFQRAGAPRRTDADWTKIQEAKFEREDGYLYLLDADGDIARVEKERPKSKQLGEVSVRRSES
jgi:hypothetical protein